MTNDVEIIGPGADKLTISGANTVRIYSSWINAWLRIRTAESWTPDAQFVMLGQGPLKDDVSSRVEALGLQEKVHLTGWRDQAQGLMAAADVIFSAASAAARARFRSKSSRSRASRHSARVLLFGTPPPSPVACWK